MRKCQFFLNGKETFFSLFLTSKSHVIKTRTLFAYDQVVCINSGGRNCTVMTSSVFLTTRQWSRTTFLSRDRLEYRPIFRKRYFRMSDCWQMKDMKPLVALSFKFDAKPPSESGLVSRTAAVNRAIAETADLFLPRVENLSLKDWTGE